MEIAVAVIQVLHAIVKVRNELKQNHSECIRLCHRCWDLKNPLEHMMTVDKNSLDTKRNALNTLLTNLTAAERFVSEYLRKTAINFMTKLVFRSKFNADIIQLGINLDRSVADLQLAVSVDVESRRREDILDARNSFNHAITFILEQATSQHNLTTDMLGEIQRDIVDNQACLVELLKLRDYSPLSVSEIQTLQNENSLLLRSTEEKFKQIVDSLDQIKALVGDLALTKAQEEHRQHSLKRLEISHADVDISTSPFNAGSFGEIYVGKLRKKRTVAIKILHNMKNGLEQPLTSAQIRGAESEILLMDYLRDPSIAVCYGFVADPRQFMVVLELAPYGSLWDVVENDKMFPLLPFALSMAWLCDLIDALKHIHVKQVVHKDIKCENLLLYAGLAVKLSDFGLSKHNTSLGKQSSVLGAGTGSFMAPEIRNGLKSSPASDVFSFVMTVVQVFSRSHPHCDDSQGQIIRSISRHQPINKYLTTEIVDELSGLLTQCAEFLVAKRPSSKTVSTAMFAILEKLGGDPRADYSNSADFVKVAEIESRCKIFEQTMIQSVGGISPIPVHSPVKSHESTTTADSSDGSKIGFSPAELATASMALWIRSNVQGLRFEDSESYARLFYANKAATIDRAAKKSGRDGNWLISIGITDVDDAEDLAVALRTQSAVENDTGCDNIYIATAVSSPAEQSQHSLSEEKSKQHGRAIQLYMKIRTTNHPPSLTELINMVDTGDEIAIGLYARCLFTGGVNGVMINTVEAVRLAECVLEFLREAAYQGNKYSQFILSWFNNFGIVLDINYVESFRYANLSADQGLAMAQYAVGIAYEKGEGVVKNVDDAFKFYQLAADQGHADGQYAVGQCYKYGTGVAVDLVEALRYFQLAADQGHADGQYAVGQCYMYGTGVAVDLVEALRYFQLAADQGHAPGQYYVGFCLGYGKGVAVDLVESLKCYQLAADQGAASAQFAVGGCYERGRGVAIDLEEALKYYQLAADYGLQQAQNSVALCYYHGKGVDVDMSMARHYWELAAAQGDKEAIENLKMVESIR